MKRGKIAAAVLLLIGFSLITSTVNAQEMFFWEVGYTQGSTDVGSSGSPLLNDQLQVIGQLTAGNSFCDNFDQPGVSDYYGKFTESWDLGIADFLDNSKKARSVNSSKSPENDSESRPLSCPGLMSKKPFSKAFGIVIDESVLAVARKDFNRLTFDGDEKRQVLGAHIRGLEINENRWEKVTGPDQKTSWRTAIKAPGVLTLRVLLDGIDKADEVLVYGDPDQNRARAVNLKRAQPVWSPSILGDTIFIEVMTDSATPPELVIDEISCGFKSVVQKEVNTLAADCYLDPNCYSEYNQEKNAVGAMIFEDGQYSYACTGSLIMDASGSFTPWFFSANHCINAPETAASLEVSFFYYTNGCEGSVPNYYDLPYTDGSELMAHSPESDFSLMRLDEDPPAGTTFLGWTLEEPDVDDDVSVLHHPNGEYMRLSFGYIIGDASFDAGNGGVTSEDGYSDDDDDGGLLGGICGF